MPISAILRSTLRMLMPLQRPTEQVEWHVLKAQQDLLMQIGKPIGWALVINSFIIGLCLASSQPNLPVAIWTGISTSYGLFILYGYSKFSKRPKRDRVSIKLLRASEFGAALTGMLYGSAYIYFAYSDIYASFFLAISIAGMAAGLTSLASTLPRLTFRYLIFSIGPMCATLLVAYGYNTVNIEGLPMYAPVTALLAVVLAAALIQGSLLNYHRLVALVTTRTQASQAKNDLIDAIEATDDAFVILNQHGQARLANGTHRAWFGTETPATLTGGTFLHSNQRVLHQTAYPFGKGETVLIHRDVTVQHQHEQELQQARADTQAAMDSQSNFLSNMSHELLTPLNIITGFADLMSRDSNLELSSDTAHEYVDNILQSATDLKQVLVDFIEYARLTTKPNTDLLADDHEIDQEPLKWFLEELVCSAQCKAETSDKNLTIRLITHGVDDDLAVYIKPAFAILSRLLENAVKFSPQDGTIYIRLRQTPTGRLSVIIVDNGPGIPAQNIENVFTPFWRQDTSFASSTQGAGLGLTLAQRIAHHGGGDISLTSSLGKGTAVEWSIGPDHMPYVTTDVPSLAS